MRILAITPRRANPVHSNPDPARIDRSVASLIDHTILKPEATRAEVAKVCAEARIYHFASVCVNGYWVPLVSEELSGSLVKVCTVVGFPLGAMSTESKYRETEGALRNGAQEIDMVLNVGELRANETNAVQEEIATVVRVSRDAGALVKVILETSLLTNAEIELACKLAVAAGAQYVKTSTGFGSAGASVANVALMRRVVGPDVGVKASGGIRTLALLREMVAAGANRIGTSAGVGIIEAANAEHIVGGS